MKEIRRIVIQEGIKRWQIRYYLAIITNDGIQVCFQVPDSHAGYPASSSHPRANLSPHKIIDSINPHPFIGECMAFGATMVCEIPFLYVQRTFLRNPPALLIQK
jgi:hypothetical protein